MEQGSNPTSPPHVLIFPLPAQGPVNSTLKLAELLCLAGLKVTFLNSEHIHERLVRFTDAQARFAKHPGFQFSTITDGLPADHPRTGDRFMEMFEAMNLVTKPVFKEMMIKARPPVDCIMGDGILGFLLDVAIDVGIPIIHFRTISACYFWTCFCIHDMIEAGELPIRGNEDMDRLITKVPGMEAFLRCRDLPSFCRLNDMEDPDIQLAANEARRSPQAQALILNTFEDLEGPIVSQIRTECPKTYTIGPLHQHLKAKQGVMDQESYQSSSSSIRKVDRSCITWLDNQPVKSVIYVSFGSLAVMTRDQHMEIWHGLVNSKKRFLWVVRPDSVIKEEGDDPEKMPLDLVEGTKERGYLVEWAPQEEVLAHNAVGGFFTHSGWNSTLESIVAGVPMICWPYFVDQQVNSRFVSEVWNLGLDMKDVCDRRIVEKMVNELMEDRREEFASSAARMAELARKSVNEGGSSSDSLFRLIQDVKLMSVGSK